MFLELLASRPLARVARSFPMLKETKIVIYFDTRGDVYFCNEDWLPSPPSKSQWDWEPVGQILADYLCNCKYETLTERTSGVRLKATNRVSGNVHNLIFILFFLKAQPDRSIDQGTFPFCTNICFPPVCSFNKIFWNPVMFEGSENNKHNILAS